MKLLMISILLIPLTLLADGPMGENVHGRYGPESIFTEEAQEPIPPKGFDREKCFKGNAKFRIYINRIRTISFRIERKCSKGSGNVHQKECSNHVKYMEEIFGLMNRQFEILEKVCL